MANAPKPGPRFHPAVLAGALWAAVAVGAVRRHLKRDGLRTNVLRPLLLGDRARRGVDAALRRLSPTCLEGALVEQTWLVEVGSPRDVIIGVPPGGMKERPAHAWVDGTDPTPPGEFLELHRLPPPPPRGPYLGGRSH